jgi:multidrug efflux pump subunit AcrA (membrane-fusion protein)
MSANSTIAIPVPAATTRKRALWRIIPAVIILVAGLLALRLRTWKEPEQVLTPGQLYTVTPTDLEVKIVKDGELQAIHYTDVECKVEGSALINWLIKEGTTVKKDQELIKLDGSNLQTRKEQVDLDVKKAEANLKIAQDMKDIQESQNATNLEAAQIAEDLARLDLARYQGTSEQAKADAATDAKMAELNLQNKQDDLNQTLALFAKGFVTGADVKKAQMDVLSATNALKHARKAREVSVH